MRKIQTSAYEIATNYIGVKEIAGTVQNNPLIMAMHHVTASWVKDDETPWCSSFVNWICFQLQPHVPMSRNAAARSWLNIGNMVPLSGAERGFDVVVFQRGDGIQPGPTVLNAPGHVAFFDEVVGDKVKVLGGNQGNTVNVATFPISRILGVRRLY